MSFEQLDSLTHQQAKLSLNQMESNKYQNLRQALPVQNSAISIKCKCGSEVRRVTVHTVPTFDELIFLIHRLFRAKLSPNLNSLTLKYIDEDFDLVSITDDLDINHAIAISPNLKVMVFDREKNPFPENSEIEAGHLSSPYRVPALLSGLDKFEIRQEIAELHKKMDRVLKALGVSGSLDKDDNPKQPKPLSEDEMNKLLENSAKPNSNLCAEPKGQSSYSSDLDPASKKFLEYSQTSNIPEQLVAQAPPSAPQPSPYHQQPSASPYQPHQPHHQTQQPHSVPQQQAHQQPQQTHQQPQQQPQQQPHQQYQQPGPGYPPQPATSYPQPSPYPPTHPQTPTPSPYPSAPTYPSAPSHAQYSNPASSPYPPQQPTTGYNSYRS